MSTASELRGAVIAASRQVDQEIRRLSDYQGELEEAERKIDAALGGSARGDARQMTGQLQVTRQRVAAALADLTAAREKLTRVSAL